MGGMSPVLCTPSDCKLREPKGEGDSDDSDEEEGSEEGSEEESGDERPAAAAALPNENPNQVKKGPVKATAVTGPPAELTRKERSFPPRCPSDL
jgi:hypothetical protein